MKLITRDTDYAVRALCFISKCEKRIVSVSELVTALEIPRSFLRQILQLLNKQGILKSYKGSGGGFELTISANKVFLLKLITIFQGPLKLNECLLRKAPCPNMRVCKLKERMDSIQRFVIAQLKDVTLASLSE